MTKARVFSAIVLLLVFLKSESQEKSQPAQLKLMFYNVENLFDIYDDSITLDNDFLPDGGYYWTYNRFEKKLNNIYKVIMAAGQWHVPDIIGFAEIENRYVLKKLTEDTPLSKFNYQIIHENSPDIRGIDVGLIYRSDNFKVLEYKYRSIFFERNPDIKTRDILYVKGVAAKDTLHVFVNHWPSRWGGAAASEFKRMHVANVLKSMTDSLQRVHANPNIIITGDFNDDPDNKSVETALNASRSVQSSGKYLFNLSVTPCRQKLGTLKYRDEWNCFDQMIVSGSLLDEDGWTVKDQTMKIFNADFILTDDDRYGGKKPFRTYLGRKYQGGYSDHLPVMVTFVK